MDIVGPTKAEPSLRVEIGRLPHKARKVDPASERIRKDSKAEDHRMGRACERFADVLKEARRCGCPNEETANRAT